MNTIQTIGFAGGAAANNVDTALGPWYWYFHPELFKIDNLQLNWLDIIDYYSENQGKAVLLDLKSALLHLSQSIEKHIKKSSPLLILGGDHSLAIGTWPVIAKKYSHNLGIMWIDAHLDAHTPNSSKTQNIHGMPLAYLLGLWNGEKVFRPEQVCVLGVRSYEPEEYSHLQTLGVKIFMMDEIRQKGLAQCMKEAIDYLQLSAVHLGLSIDLDAFDPADCPGVGYREKNGLRTQDFFDFFQSLVYKNWVAVEIAEFNPMRDVDQKTAIFLPHFLKHILG